MAVHPIPLGDPSGDLPLGAQALDQGPVGEDRRVDPLGDQHPLGVPGREGEGLMGDMGCIRRVVGFPGDQTFVVGEGEEEVGLVVHMERVGEEGEVVEEEPQPGSRKTHQGPLVIQEAVVGAAWAEHEHTEHCLSLVVAAVAAT